MIVWIRQVCPKCGGTGAHDRGEATITPCSQCAGAKFIQTDQFINIGALKTTIDNIWDKVKTL